MKCKLNKLKYTCITFLGKHTNFPFACAITFQNFTEQKQFIVEVAVIRQTLLYIIGCHLSPCPDS